MQPYVGPRSFERKDQTIFYGRDKEARDLLSLIIANNVVLIYSPSGAGKTSLMNAKLIPLLKKEGFEVLPLARVRSMTTLQINPEKISNIYIFNSLMKWFERKYEVERLAEMSMVDFLNERDHKQDNDGLPLPRAIIFDQFEELFTLHLDRWKDRANFFEQVSRSLENDSLLRIVFVMREDHIAKLDPYVHLLPNTLIRFHIDRMRKEAALLAIKGPLNLTEKSFAEGVAEKLVDNLLKIRIETHPGDTVWVPGEFVEALQLQVVCQSLWQKLAEKDKQITLDHIEKDGNIDQALSLFYEDTIQEAKIYVDEERMRRWFEDVLITSMGTRGTVYRGPQSTGGISNSVIDILENMHLIRAEWRAGARWYELTHDRFIDPILSSNNAFNLKIKGVTEIENSRWIANEYIVDAEHAWGLKNYDNSIQKYQEALVIYEKIGDSSILAETLLNYARLLQKLNRNEEAEEHYKKAIQINPKYSELYMNYANLLLKLDRLKEAEECYKRAIQINPPKYSELHLEYANLLLKLDRLNEAEEHYKQAIQINPKSSKLYLNYANLLLKLDRINEAEKYYKQAIQIDPYSSRALKLKRIKEAEINYKRAIQKNPTASEAYLNYANLLLKLDRIKEAEEHYKKAIQINPKYGKAHLNYANLLLKLDRIKEAEKHYKQAIQTNPKYSEAYLNYANLLLKLDRIKEAEGRYKQAVQTNPKYSEAYLNHANLLLKLDRIKEAEEHYKKAIQINPKYGKAHLNYANLLLKLDRIKEAEKHYNWQIHFK